MPGGSYCVRRKNGLNAFKKRPAVLDVHTSNNSKTDLGRPFLFLISEDVEPDHFILQVRDSDCLSVLLIVLILMTLKLLLSDLALHPHHQDYLFSIIATC